jgi:hypothetical protein
MRNPAAGQPRFEDANTQLGLKLEVTEPCILVMLRAAFATLLFCPCAPWLRFRFTWKDRHGSPLFCGAGGLPFFQGACTSGRPADRATTAYQPDPEEGKQRSAHCPGSSWIAWNECRRKTDSAIQRRSVKQRIHA